MTDPTDEFHRIIDGLEQLPTQEQVLRVWAAQQAAAIMRGRPAPFGALAPMDPGSVIVMADWIITGAVSVVEEDDEGWVPPDVDD